MRDKGNVMALKVFKPYSKGTRTRVDLVREEVTADKPEKSLTHGMTRHGGRGAGGRISEIGRAHV